MAITREPDRTRLLNALQAVATGQAAQIEWLQLYPLHIVLENSQAVLTQLGYETLKTFKPDIKVCAPVSKSNNHGVLKHGIYAAEVDALIEKYAKWATANEIIDLYEQNKRFQSPKLAEFITSLAKRCFPKR